MSTTTSPGDNAAQPGAVPSASETLTARIAEARKNFATSKPQPSNKPIKAVKAAPQPDPESDDEEETSNESVTEEVEETVEDTGDVSSIKEEIKGHLVNGDLKAICKILGVSTNLADVADGKFARLRKNAKALSAERKAFEAEKIESKQETTKLRNVVNYVDRNFGPLIEGIEEFNKGNYRALANAFPKLLKVKGVPVDFATITRLIAGLEHASPTEKAEWDRKEREASETSKAEEKAKKTKEDADAKEASARAINKVRERIKGHNILKRKDGAILVFEEMKRHYNEGDNTFKITTKRAADNVLQRLKDEATELGLIEKAPKKPAPKPKATFQGFSHKPTTGTKAKEPDKFQSAWQKAKAQIDRQNSLKGR